ncbi:MAG TPA: sigma-70 family RNA polymerase sigma factor [Jatrophihabitans sp.]|nr:sigma-70 family RNA polymerase sigma factor [Jatrophihabitans sp.]
MEDGARHAQLERWFRAYGDRVLAYLLHRTERETAQDVLQEVFVTAFRKAAEVPDPPIGWLLGSARRLLANANRSEQRRTRLALRIADTNATNGQAADDDAASDAVARALAQLPDRDREVLTLSAWYGLTADEAAQALGCSRSAYAVRLHRARHRLADRLRATGFRPGPVGRLPEAAHE